MICKIPIILIIFLGLNMELSENKLELNNLESIKALTASEILALKAGDNAEAESTGTPINKEPNLDLNTTNTEIGNKRAIKDGLISEFKDYLKKIQLGDRSEYNLIMASSLAYGLTNTFSLTEEEEDFVQSNYIVVRAPLKHSIVYNGYSEDGVHFIAMISPGSIENAAYKDAVNIIRNSDDEYDFLSYITDSSPSRILYVALDVYAEDLSGIQNIIKIDGITLSNPDGELIKKPIYGDNINKMLSMYNRNSNENNIIEGKKWYTFVLDGTLIYQPTIIINYNGKQIRLEK